MAMAKGSHNGMEMLLLSQFILGSAFQIPPQELLYCCQQEVTGSMEYGDGHSCPPIFNPVLQNLRDKENKLF